MWFAADDEWSLDEGLEPDGPSADDLDRFGDELITCGHCGRRIYDQAELCTYCGMVVGDGADKPVPGWVGLVVVLVILGLLLMWVL